MSKTYYFILGSIVQSVLLLTHQDYLGLERYMNHVQQHWIEVEPWWIWLIILGVIILFTLFAEWITYKQKSPMMRLNRALEDYFNHMESQRRHHD